jgi:hypothetical protein
MQNVVTEWFGESFAGLNPLLQKLHQEGGVLSGQVDVSYGRGIAGFMGRRIAKKLGVPLVPGKVNLIVTISHDVYSLHWNRLFGNLQKMNSTFIPYGHYPNGFWRETTGDLTLELGVEIKQGAWCWRQRRIRYMGIPLPQLLMPKTKAYKKLVNGKYRFYVSVRLPLLGEVLQYSGDLGVS